MKWQVRIFLADRHIHPCGVTGIAHLLDPQPNAAGFDDVDAVHAIDEIDEPAIVDRHVVGRRPLRAGGRIGQEMTDLLRRERIGEVDQPQPLREPGERNDGAV